MQCNLRKSKVVEVNFDKGPIVFTYDIYYASRDSLIEMGVPVNNNKNQVSFPEAFKSDKYCTPPKNWTGR